MRKLNEYFHFNIDVSKGWARFTDIFGNDLPASKAKLTAGHRQMAENHAYKLDKNFWMVVKQKPKWMPNFIYKAVIKELVEFQKHNIINPSPAIKEERNKQIN